jgi:hypothetical protein
MGGREDFTDGATPVLLAAAGEAPDGRVMVVLVIDDSGEDDITAAIAATAADAPFAHDFSGEWGFFEDRTGSVLRFTLKSAAGAAHRRWLIDHPRDVMVALLNRDHVVVLMPAEIAGDLSDGVDFSGIPARLKASLLVDVSGADPSPT